MQKKWIKINSNVNFILKYQNVPLFLLHLAYDIIKREQKAKQKMSLSFLTIQVLPDNIHVSVLI